MTPQTAQRLKEVTDYFDLRVKYITELPDNVHGFFEPTSHQILVNARKSPSDQVFTIAHEMGHYVIHYDRPARKPSLHWCMDYPWKSTMMIESVKMTKNWIMPIFEQEGEADAWASCICAG